jgi:hypothetical protein
MSQGRRKPAIACTLFLSDNDFISVDSWEPEGSNALFNQLALHDCVQVIGTSRPITTYLPALVEL